LPVGLADEDLKRLDALITKRRVINKGETLFQIGDKFERLVAVRSGAFKTFVSDADGEQAIIGFHLPGELLGFDGITSGQYQVSAQAIETSSICEIPFNELLTFAAKMPSLQRQLLSIMSQKTMPDIAVRLNNSAEQRLASFLLGLSKRFKNCGYSESEFNLPMSREDIANYLGLAPETISRLLSHFQADGILEINRRHIVLHDFRRLQIIQCSDH
jgi:CRP/FNR family transcriptional regulator